MPTGTYKLTAGKHRGERLGELAQSRTGMKYLGWCKRNLRNGHADGDAVRSFLAAYAQGRDAAPTASAADVADYIVKVGGENTRLADIADDELARRLFKYPDSRHAPAIARYLTMRGVPLIEDARDPRLARVLHRQEPEQPIGKCVVADNGANCGRTLDTVSLSWLCWYVAQLPVELRTTELLTLLRDRVDAYVDEEIELNTRLYLTAKGEAEWQANQERR